MEDAGRGLQPIVMLRSALALILVTTLACDLIAAPPATQAPGASASPGVGAPASPGTPASPGAVPGDMSAALRAKPLPLADSFELARQVRGRSGQPDKMYEPIRTTPPDEGIGSRERFWVYDWDKKENFQVGASIRAMTASAKWWIADDVQTVQSDLDQAAAQFETRIVPAVRGAYGSEWSPGIDGDPRINVLVARIPGQAAGYYSSTDEQPGWVFENSAEREIFYLNVPPGGRLAANQMYGTIAHELCHMIQFNKRARSIVWFSEGQAELCSRAGSGQTSSSGFEGLFLQQPNTQLNDWPELGNVSALHYGGAFLLLEYLRQHAGGEALINAFLAEGIDTPDDLDKVLRARGQKGFEELFTDFVAANALIRETAKDDRYRYAPGMARIAAAAAPGTRDRVGSGGTLQSDVKPYAARYIELPRAATLQFQGATTARVIPTDAPSGRSFWWSDRSDLLDSTLERAIDLRSVRAATLKFRTWYEIEADFDYAYVEVSTDGGGRWTTLKATSTTSTDPNGVNLGQGLTGLSGGGSDAAWVEQTADLSGYAGREIRLRFQYVTDGALNLHGIAIDDIEIPEISFRDDAESDGGGWTADGFVRSSNIVSQRYALQLIRFGQTVTVERHLVENGTFSLAYDAAADRRAPLLSVTPFAVRTIQPAVFTLSAR